MVRFEIADETKDEPIIRLSLTKDSNGDAYLIAKCGEEWAYLMTFKTSGMFYRHPGVELPGVSLDLYGRIKEDTK